jgi:Spy/CpxP family protein refolding chaperone
MGFFWGAVTVAVIAYAVTKRRRYRRFWQYGGFHHHPRYDDDFGPHFARGYRKRGRFLFGLFRRLDVSPGQEKALIEMAERIREHMDDTLPELRAARKEVAAALGSEVLDQSAVDAAFARSAELAEKLSRELREAIGSVHQLLDAEQRRVLAAWIADGSFGTRFGRSHAYGC